MGTCSPGTLLLKEENDGKWEPQEEPGTGTPALRPSGRERGRGRKRQMTSLASTALQQLTPQQTKSTRGCWWTPNDSCSKWSPGMPEIPPRILVSEFLPKCNRVLPRKAMPFLLAGSRFSVRDSGYKLCFSNSYTLKTSEPL